MILNSLFNDQGVSGIPNLAVNMKIVRKNDFSTPPPDRGVTFKSTAHKPEKKNTNKNRKEKPTIVV